MDVHRLLRAVESFRAVDRPAAAAAERFRRVLETTGTSRLLRGSWLGHPLHPLLVTVPIGAWVSSAVLDFGSGNQDTARKLVAIGLAATPPTMLLGAADYSGLDRRQRRVGAVHAVANTMAAALFGASYHCRTRNAEGKGRVFGLLGLAAVGVGGALGGHLSYAQGAGVHRWQSAEPAPEVSAKPGERLAPVNRTSG
jgi:uncharacterized membrane protein